MKLIRVILIAFIFALSIPNICLADTAEVLPKGVFLFDATYYHYFNIHKRYNPDGDSEDIDRDYNTEPDSSVFSALAPIDALLGQTASVGRSVVDFYWQYRWFEFTLNYGITDKLTAYVLLPYNYSKNNISSRVDNSTANVGKNSLYGTPEDPFQSPIIPISMGGIPLIAPLTASMLSGLFLYSIFPPLKFSFLAWISLIPVLLLLHRTGSVQSFFLGFLSGILLSGLHVKWLNVVPGLPLTAFFAIIIYSAMYFGFFGLLFGFIKRRTGYPATVIAPFLWVALEYLKSNFSFLAIPWVLLGYSQYTNIPMIQIASFTSVYGISFLIVFVNAAASDGIIWISRKLVRDEGRESSAVIPVVSFISALILTGGVYLWGVSQVKSLSAHDEPILRASLVQGNIPQHKKWSIEEKKNILDHYANLTMEASKESPDLIVWPETATPASLKEDEQVKLSVTETVRDSGIPLLTGSSSTGKIVVKGRKMKRDFNSAFLLDKSGQIASTYSKMRLLPFGEYVPFEGKFPWPKWLVPISGICVPGDNPTVFEFPKGKFGVVICWEALFPRLFRTFVQGGSEFMLNLTNEAWFGETEASRQILAMSVFRAVENRVSLLRCANTGITCLIDPVGRIRSRVSDEQGNDIMVTGILTVHVPRQGVAPFYSKYGDIFAIICAIGAIVITVMALLPLKMRKYLKVTCIQ